ncbi:MAG: hypothetical protein JWP62_3774 [Blastococcus sp.]|nr:hypothetical protein [Blastococcus sp.]
MTPTRALFGVAVAAAAAYAVIHSVNDEGPQYLGDFPSIIEQAQAEPPAVIPGVTPGPPVPDPPHFDAQPVVPETPADPPPGPAGPGPVGGASPAPGGTGGGGGAPQPGMGSPLTSPLPPFGDLLAGLPLIGTLPAFDPTDLCIVDGVVVGLVSCDQIPPVVPPVVPPVEPPVR